VKWWPWSGKTDSDGGAEARRRAEKHLAEVQAQWPEVNRVAASLRELRRRNGFGEQLTWILRNEDGKNR
jgi:hypothetical protein